MMADRLATICVLRAENALLPFASVLESVLGETPPEKTDIRLGFERCEPEMHYALGTLCPEGATPGWCQLPGGVERFHWKTAAGSAVHVWNSSMRLGWERMARLLFHDVPLQSDYAVWLDGAVEVEADWWGSLAPLLEQDFDVIGRAVWREYTPRQLETLPGRPWYMGVPFELRDGKPGVSFMTGGIVAVRSERLREADFPREGAGGDVLLGEIARQLGWRRAEISSKKM